MHEFRGGYLEFTHYSFSEFFLAKFICKELLDYNASTIARLNLIGYYDVNRFLVPMLQKVIQHKKQKSSRGKTTKILANGKIFLLSELVDRRLYREFLNSTGWRRSIGHGIHPSYEAPNGTPCFSSNIDQYVFFGANMNRIEKTDDTPATGISWYDAYQYCRWKGGRLPNQEEVKAFIDRQKINHPRYLWGWEWYDETRSHISIIPSNKRQEVVGVNPDYRNTLIGFCVCYPESDK